MAQKLSMAEMLDYLDSCDSPWDSKYHAAKNLVTVYGIGMMLAISIAEFTINTKESESWQEKQS